MAWALRSGTVLIFLLRVRGRVRISTGDVSPTSQPLAVPRIGLEPRYHVPKLIFLLFDKLHAVTARKLHVYFVSSRYA